MTTIAYRASQIAKFMGPTWGPPGPMLAPWTLLSDCKCLCIYGLRIVELGCKGNPDMTPLVHRSGSKHYGWPDVISWCHDDVIKWKHFPRNWPFVRGIHRSPVNSPHKGQWGGALMFSLICVWINDWVNNREAGDLRRYCAQYDVSVMARLHVMGAIRPALDDWMYNISSPLPIRFYLLTVSINILIDHVVSDGWLT